MTERSDVASTLMKHTRAALALAGLLASFTCHAADAPVCSSSSGRAAAAGDELIAADTPGSDGTQLFPRGKSIRIDVTTRATRDDKVRWDISDTWSRTQASGSFAVAAGPRVTSLTCTMPQAGYFAFSASLASQSSAGLPQRGTRPAGIATFGVLPDVSSALPAPTFSRQDLHRFGGQGSAYIAPGQHCCGGDGLRPLYTDLGLAWANDKRGWYVMEPKGPNTFDPASSELDLQFKPGDIMRLIQLDGIPAWASPNGQETHSFAPNSLGQLRDYMARVGTESARIRAKTFPRQARNYYQVTWEPDADGGLPWKDTDAHFVDLYKTIYEGIHSTDPSAVVMGPTYAGVQGNTKWLKQFAPLGIARYLDGVTIHGYYDFGTSPSHPPERLYGTPDKGTLSLPEAMRELRATMRDVLKPGAPLFVTETGISYDIGKNYAPDYPDAQTLYAQGAVVARAHLIMLGEGADTTFIFYGADMPETTAGYGVFFELDHPKGMYGASNISPKPAALAVATMTRLVDGTYTLGPLRGTPAGVYAYAFARPNNDKSNGKSGGKVITALWSHDNARWSAKAGFDSMRATNYTLQVDARGRSGQVSVFDMMGNPTTMTYNDGMLPLRLTESPVYVVSDNADVMRSNAITPAGYVAPKP
ncbi:hypothetical protein [Paraburkholderia unamae]|uniref:Glycosyl hydrolase family 39 n=1 Tax=Paraburkholderia unamae TaxID=219649 RepID=A0ABX5KXB6_9BURK|nr:hypothetical protein [Paraburkholderia unamae]PVX98031.1 hypothetical protein C7402_101749 [Paraburkholderia unamae]CAG9249263.1 conserved exported hypothetical protein [Paraburkholderia unamae]